MVVSSGKLRPATQGEIADLEMRDLVPWEPIRLPGTGREGLAALLSDGGAQSGTSAAGFLITCTCGHLFVDEMPEA